MQDGILFRESTEEDYAVLKSSLFLLGSKDKLICYNGEVVGVINYTEREPNIVYIELIMIFKEYRRKGLGTLAVLHLKSLFEGRLFCGDILYKDAYRFWSSLRDKVDTMGSLDYYDYDCEWGGLLSFEFK